MTSITERVAAGAALLDEREPGWWKGARIDLDRLDLGDDLDCTGGQLYGTYADALDWLELDVRAAASLGLECSCVLCPGYPVTSHDAGEYPALNAEWRRVITERRAAS